MTPLVGDAFHAQYDDAGACTITSYRPRETTPIQNTHGRRCHRERARATTTCHCNETTRTRTHTNTNIHAHEEKIERRWHGLDALSMTTCLPNLTPQTQNTIKADQSDGVACTLPLSMTTCQSIATTRTSTPTHDINIDTKKGDGIACVYASTMPPTMTTCHPIATTQTSTSTQTPTQKTAMALHVCPHRLPPL